MLNRIGFKSFPMSELRQKQTEAQKQNKGVEIRMKWVDETSISSLPDFEAIGATCIVTTIGKSREKPEGEAWHFQSIEGFVDTVDEETGVKGFKKDKHPLVVNNKGVCISHDIKGIRDLPCK